MVTVEGMIEAYYNCLRGKKGTAGASLFETDFIPKVCGLVRRINARDYTPARSVCFIVTRPRCREVFAAKFDDRVVHHWMALRLEPLFESFLTGRSFNCRRGKGRLFGVARLYEDIRECSGGYTRDCWVMRLDIAGYFMSIDKERLADMADAFILANYRGADVEDLRYVCGVTIRHCPEKLCERHSPLRMWDALPRNKSLFTNGEGLGMPIGNLPSQHLANFQLDGLDRFVTERLGFPHYGRYVDDFYIVHTDKAALLAAVPEIRAYLRDNGLKLHPHKFYLQHYTKGVRFVGSVVKRERTYAGNRTVGGLVDAVKRLGGAVSSSRLERAAAVVNSYLGSLRHADSYAIRRRVLSSADPEVFRRAYIRGHFDSVAVKRRHTTRAATLRRIYDGLR